jgi:NAD(P)H-nitrite reductase large subunit
LHLKLAPVITQIGVIHLTNKENRIAIVGNGCAGAECIKALRGSGYSGEIHVITDSKWPIYNPTLTTYYIAGKINFDQLFPYGKGDKFYRKYNVDVHPASPVAALDTEKKVITSRAGFELGYNQCLIASGASPVLPPVKGIDSKKVYLMRTVEDAIKLKEALDKKPRKALVIGASMIGIKLVELFYKAGMEICLSDLADRIFPVNAHPECSLIIEDRLRKLGIKLRFGANMRKVEDCREGVKAYFDDSSESEQVDLIVMCIGVRANTSFIDRSQVEVKQGILVEEHMKTNVPDLYAAGDVCQGKNLLTGKQQIIGLWANARYQGRTAGRNMAGIREIFPGNIPHNITHFMGIDFVGIGDICEYDRMEQKYNGKRLTQLFWKDKLLTGANFIDSFTESGVIKNALLKGLKLNSKIHGNSLPVLQDMLIRKTLTEVGKI